MNLKIASKATLMLIWLVNTIALITENTAAESTTSVMEGTKRKRINQSKATSTRRYLLYEVNHSEGFNLRRDVYMRMANLVLRLRENDDWILVLPPWGPLYHWKSMDVGEQTKIPWSRFFDVASLGKHVPVVELHDFVQECGSIDRVYFLQYFADTFKEGATWVDKYEEAPCLDPGSVYYHYDDGRRRVHGWFWGYDDIVARNFSCLSLQGQAGTLVPLLLSEDARAILLDRAEIVLHDSYGDAAYWRARRSMRFAQRLTEVGDRFRREHLESTDHDDGTETDPDWTRAKVPTTAARGGPYVAVHLRRQDFLHGRKEHVPSLKNAARQIDVVLKRLNLTRAFVATDAPDTEFDVLRSYLPGAVRYVPDAAEKAEFGDGGVAIVDQWICAHSRYFVGTYESTFSFRIQEEREILGFRPDATYNRLCGDGEDDCTPPTRWPIVY